MSLDHFLPLANPAPLSPLLRSLPRFLQVGIGVLSIPWTHPKAAGLHHCTFAMRLGPGLHLITFWGSST